MISSARRPASGWISRQRVKIRFALERLVEQPDIATARDFGRPEAAQMFGHILRVEQFKASGDQAGDEMHQRHLRSVAGAMKHAFAEECAAKIDAVKTADQIVVFQTSTLWAWPSPCSPT